MKLRLMYVISIFILIILCFSACTQYSQFENATEEPSADYDTSTIIVMIKKEYSEFGKEYTPEDFDSKLIKKVTVLNQINLGDDTSGYDLNNWKLVLSLELREPSEENVQKSIEAAYKNPEVESAHKNFKVHLVE